MLTNNSFELTSSKKNRNYSAVFDNVSWYLTLCIKEIRKIMTGVYEIYTQGIRIVNIRRIIQQINI